jgi:hypothetical protein
MIYYYSNCITLIYNDRYMTFVDYQLRKGAMATIDIYDEEKLARLLHVQKVHSVDFDHEINWNRSVDLSKGLLPLDSNAILFPTASVDEKLVISQMMGLIVASTIAELENVAFKLKDSTWDNILKKYPVNPEIREMGELFYEDEKKHSRAFNRYIDKFALEVGIDPQDLRTILPQANVTTSMAYQLNSLAGGMAIWWLIAAVEEESILIFDYMKKEKKIIDPLYYDIHKAHYEEEVRHKSYASIMLEINHSFAKLPQKLIFEKLDFVVAQILNMAWTFNELYKVKGIKRFANHHSFFKTLNDLSETLNNRSSLEILGVLFNSAPYIKEMLNLSEHKHIKIMLERFSTKSIAVAEMNSKKESRLNYKWGF